MISSRSVSISILAVVFAAIVTSACSTADRRDEFAAAAEGLSMTLHAEFPVEYARVVQSLPGVATRPDSRFPHVIANDSAMVFDWVVGDEEAGDLREQTVFAFRYRNARLPRFLLAGKYDVSEAEIADGGGVIEFTTPEQWLERYVLIGTSKGALRRLFPVEVRSNFTLPGRTRIEATGEWVFVYQVGRSVSPGTFGWELGDARALVAMWQAL